jgi:hypothetical protein
VRAFTERCTVWEALYLRNTFSHVGHGISTLACFSTHAFMWNLRLAGKNISPHISHGITRECGPPKPMMNLPWVKAARFVPHRLAYRGAPSNSVHERVSSE